MDPEKIDEKTIVVFHEKVIRRIWIDDKWFFSVVDIIGALTESVNPRDYWYRLKQREKGSIGIELSTFCRQLKLPFSDGKSYETECADTERVFGIIQSIPSKKAEPFKRWPSKVVYERIQEIDDPEMAQRRMKELYRQKEYSEEWIETIPKTITLLNSMNITKSGGLQA
jgi:hypothetical protein